MPHQYAFDGALFRGTHINGDLVGLDLEEHLVRGHCIPRALCNAGYGALCMTTTQLRYSTVV